MATSDQLLAQNPDAVLTLGDNQYETGALSDFLGSYDPSWGRLKAKIHPAVGNHEYITPGAEGYFDYFNGAGAATGPAGDRSQGYYSFDLGSWHLVAINSHCPALPDGCAEDSPQMSWLRDDLAGHRDGCVLAYWHHPRFSSGQHGSRPDLEPFWQTLYDAGADVVLNGHDHDYERFAPQAPDGHADGDHGIREFVVGTGGRGNQRIKSPIPNSEANASEAIGVLKMTLHTGSYDWEFLPTAGTSFTDSGSGSCHPPPG